MSRRLAPFEDRPRRRRARSNVRERSVRLAVPSILPIIERSSFLASSNDFLQAVLSFLPTTLLPFTSVMATASCLSLSLSLEKFFISELESLENATRGLEGNDSRIFSFTAISFTLLRFSFSNINLVAGMDRRTVLVEVGAQLCHGILSREVPQGGKKDTVAHHGGWCEHGGVKWTRIRAV